MIGLTVNEKEVTEESRPSETVRVMSAFPFAFEVGVITTLQLGAVPVMTTALIGIKFVLLDAF